MGGSGGLAINFSYAEHGTVHVAPQALPASPPYTHCVPTNKDLMSRIAPSISFCPSRAMFEVGIAMSKSLIRWLSPVPPSASVGPPRRGSGSLAAGHEFLDLEPSHLSGVRTPSDVLRAASLT